MGAPSTVILVPVLGRPHRVGPLVEAVERATPEPHRILFIADNDDYDELAAIREVGADAVTIDKPGTYARKINLGARESGESLIFMAADDVAPEPGWLAEAQSMLTGGVEVVGTSDGGLNPRTVRGEHSTHTLVTRSYIDGVGGVIDGPPGMVLHEGYPHEFCDDEFCGTARYRKVWAHNPNSVVRHLHPWNGTAEMDDTYRLGAAGTHAGMKLFLRRRHLWRRS